MTTTEPQTEDDRIIETVSEYLPRLNAIGEGPALDEDTLQSYGTMSVDDTRGTAYGEHLRELHDVFEDLGEDLQAYGDVCSATIENMFDYEVPDCDFLIETDPNLTWSRDLLTDPLEAVDPDEDYDQASVNHRIVDLRADGRERLFELHVDYYMPGEIHASLQVTPGYNANSTHDGGERLNTEPLFDDRLGNLDTDTVDAELESLRPFVLSRVWELVGQQNVNLSHARAMALSECGLTNEEIADRLDIGESTVRSYKSKFMAGTRDAERRMIANTPIPKTVLGEHELDITNSLSERWYVCKVETDTYATNDPYSLVTVKSDFAFGADIDVETMSYPSLRALINDVYAEETFDDDQRAEAVRDALTAIPKHKRAEAGFESLPKPNTRLDVRVP